MSLDALLLDFDGLVLDTEQAEYASLAAVFATNGDLLKFPEWHATVGSESPDWLSRLAQPGTRTYEQLAVELKRRQHEAVASQALRRGISDLLEVARRQSVPVGLVTSGTRDRIEPELERRGLLDRFATVVTREDVTETKPSPEPYLKALDALAADADRSIAFEDSSHGVAAAVAAGIRCVAVFNDITRNHDFDRALVVVDELDRLDIQLLVGHGLVQEHQSRFGR